MSWTLTRRELLKAGFTTAAVGATGAPLSVFGAEEPKDWRCSSSSTTREVFPAPSGPIADAELGLSKGSVFDVPTPAAVKANESNPGEGPLLPRPYVIAPPRVPHGVADFLPITQKQNACLDCHAVKEKKRGDPTPIPPSHYTDYRNAPDRVGIQVAGARYVCVSCHTATTGAPNLVGNRFRP